MSRIRSKQDSVARVVAPRGGPARLALGDLVEIVDIPEGMKDAAAADTEIRTNALFRFCLGRRFHISDFDEWGHIGLFVAEDRAVRRKFGKGHWISIERGYLKLIREKVE